jgi:transposase-like protein
MEIKGKPSIVYNRVYDNLFTERGLPMNDFTKEMTKTLLNGGNIKEIFRFHLEKAINELLKTELSGFLQYDKYDRAGFNTGNSRNGTYERTIKSEFGELTVEIPRDRNGDFKNQTLEPYRRHDDTLESTVIHLYRKGMTTGDIADLIEKMYGHHYSRQTVSNLTQVMESHVKAFHERPLNKRYAVIYLDATHLPVRRDTVEREAIYLAVGITPEGYKELLTYEIHPTESAYNWKELLETLKARGLEETLLFVTDGLKEIKTNIESVYPKAAHQTCWVHIARNVSHKVRTKDRMVVLEDLKRVYRSKTKEDAIQALENFSSTWKKTYPTMVKHLNANESLFSFYDFPEVIRPSLYTTNLIEAFNKQLKRYTKRKEQFPNVESLERFLVTYATDYNERFKGRIHKGFGKVQYEIDQHFNALYKN